MFVAEGADLGNLRRSHAHGRGQRPRLQHQRLNLAGVLPFVRYGSQASADGIISNVVPFLAVALVRAKNMIEEFALPERCSRGR